MKNRGFPGTPIIDAPDEAARLAAWVRLRRQALDRAASSCKGRRWGLPRA
jgi:hypothetical protein